MYTTSAIDKYKLWYLRLGHLNKGIMKIIKDYVIGIDNSILKKPDESICEGCAYAKSYWKPFPKTAENRSDRILERIHSDLCRPMPTSSYRDHRYILSFIDDASRYAWVYFIRNKSDAFKIFQEFKILVERMINTYIKVLRSDRGGKYLNDKFTKFLKQHGIQY